MRVIADGTAIAHNGAHNGADVLGPVLDRAGGGRGRHSPRIVAAVDGNGGDGTEAFPSDTIGDDTVAGAVPMAESGAAPRAPQTGGCAAGDGAQRCSSSSHRVLAISPPARGCRPARVRRAQRVRARPPARARDARQAQHEVRARSRRGRARPPHAGGARRLDRRLRLVGWRMRLQLSHRLALVAHSRARRHRLRVEDAGLCRQRSHDGRVAGRAGARPMSRPTRNVSARLSRRRGDVGVGRRRLAGVAAHDARHPPSGLDRASATAIEHVQARAVGYSYSKENDYLSHTLDVGLADELSTRTRRSALGYGVSLNTVGRAEDMNFARALTVHHVALSLTQTINAAPHRARSRTSSSYADGYQASPYRFVPVRMILDAAPDLWVPETDPDTRFRHALVVGANTRSALRARSKPTTASIATLGHHESHDRRCAILLDLAKRVESAVARALLHAKRRVVLPEL